MALLDCWAVSVVLAARKGIVGEGGVRRDSSRPDALAKDAVDLYLYQVPTMTVASARIWFVPAFWIVLE